MVMPSYGWRDQSWRDRVLTTVYYVPGGLLFLVAVIAALAALAIDAADVGLRAVARVVLIALVASVFVGAGVVVQGWNGTAGRVLPRIHWP